jgi:hypothetical protein
MLVINRVASNLPLCFIEDVVKVEEQNSDIVRDFVTMTVNFLAAREIGVSGVICDGATYQVKGLDYTQAESVQSNGDTDLLKRLLFIPCLCHRPRNAYHALVRDCASF